MAVSSAERPAATLGLPNGLAYGMAVAAVAALVILPFALAARGLSLGQAVDGYYLNTTIGFAVLGALILRRHPGHVIGWVLVATGGFDTLVRFSNEYVFFGLGDRPGFPSSDTVTALFAWMWVPTVAGTVIALPQLFPDGRLLGPRWRWPAVLGALATVLLSVVFALNPSSSANDTTDLISAVFPVFGLAMLASFVPLVVRYRRSHGVERQQLKWVFYGLAVSIPLMGLGTAGALVGASPGWSLIPVLIIPVAITVAVLRYRLYDIDLVISKTLLVAGLAAFITAAYVAIVVGVGSLVGTGNEPDLVLSVVATAVVAVAFQPVRRALRRVADRLVYGHRATPYDVLSGFATRVGAAEPSPDTLVQLAELMAGGTGADPARVWLRVGTQLRPAVTWPRDRGDEPAAVDLGPVGAPPALP
ncbi:MAG: Two component signal transduction histidine kinase, partial [Pseudonocardia sp.]|nr:Two component signal transduction histidine kinase [Pseudonocardia sp.]